jgi:hypothetical protein
VLQTPADGEMLAPDRPDVTSEEHLRLLAENEALRVRLSRRRTVRTWLSNALVVLTVIAMIASMIAIWVRETIYDTDRFMEVVEPALEDPAFYAALSDLITEDALVALDLDTRVATVLGQADAYLSEVLIDAIDPDPGVLARIQAFERPTLSALAPSIVSALEDRVEAIIDRFITSERFQDRLPDLVEQVHAGGVALITGDTASLPNVYTEDGEVRLDLVPVIAEALQEVAAEIQELLPDVTPPSLVAGAVEQGRDQLRTQLAEALDAELPEDFGQVTLMTESDLTEVQDAARRADQLVWAIAILALLLLGLSIGVSPTRRRTVIALALGVVAGAVITMLLVRRLESALLDQIVNVDGRQAIQQAYGELASSLRTITVLVALVAIVISVVAYLAGRPPWPTDLRQRWTRVTAPTPEGSQLDRWITARFDLLRLAGIAVVLLLLFLLGLELVPALVLGTLLGLYLWALTAARQRMGGVEAAVPSSAAELEELEARPTSEEAAAAGQESVGEAPNP